MSARSPKSRIRKQNLSLLLWNLVGHLIPFNLCINHIPSWWLQASSLKALSIWNSHLWGISVEINKWTKHKKMNAFSRYETVHCMFFIMFCILFDDSDDQRSCFLSACWNICLIGITAEMQSLRAIFAANEFEIDLQFSAKFKEASFKNWKVLEIFFCVFEDAIQKSQVRILTLFISDSQIYILERQGRIQCSEISFSKQLDGSSSLSRNVGFWVLCWMQQWFFLRITKSFPFLHKGKDSVLQTQKKTQNIRLLSIRELWEVKSSCSLPLSCSSFTPMIRYIHFWR